MCPLRALVTVWLVPARLMLRPPGLGTTVDKADALSQMFVLPPIAVGEVLS